MRSVFLEGETKTAKSTLGEGVRDFLVENGHQVVYGDAGQFFRRVTAVVLDRTGVVDPRLFPSGKALDEQLAPILREGIALDDTYSFGDLERTAVGDTVSLVGARPASQDAAELWFDDIASRAEKEDSTLVVNARNPRARLATWMGERGLRPSVELVLACDPETAAQRALWGRGNLQPTPAEIAATREGIKNRRDMDRGRDRNPYTDPPVVIRYVPGQTSAEGIIAATWAAPEHSAPYPIAFDVTNMPKPAMLGNACELVGAGMLALVE